MNMYIKKLVFKYVKKMLPFIAFSILSGSVFGQSTQNIRGKVVEKNTQTPISYAHVWIFVNENIVGSVTDTLGNFVIEKAPVGRREVYAKAIGYEDIVLNNVLVYAGRETVLEIAMIEKITSLEEVTIRATVDKDMPLSRMATTSVRMFSTEEANRYAGSLGDPARMAANFAGVAASNDTRNDIVIRGNSPMGILWRLDGFDIPNPNHFGAMGGTGGPIGMINNNQLANSDFYTGAFPAEFGNVTSGVFDLKLRNGNNKKQEFLISMGFNGVEAGAEGYFSKKSNASYLINARYSFLGLLAAMGVDFGTGSGIPEYTDVCAKITIPLKKGNFSFVTLLGASQIKMADDMTDETQWQSGDIGQNTTMNNYQLFFGANYTHRFSTNTRLENRFSYQDFESKINTDLITFQNTNRQKNYSMITGEGRAAWTSTVFHRINSRNFLEAGMGADFFLTNVHDQFYDSTETPTVLHNANKNSSLIKLYTQWQHRFNDNVSITPGVYGHFYTFTNDFSIEPRLGMQWKTSSNTSINFGTGLYSQLQPRLVYFYQDENEQLPNNSLGFTRSWQTVAGFNWKFAKSYRLKTEIYYQYLYHVPVIEDIPQESILNFGDDFSNSWDYVFVNKGTGQNYGVELTMEKFLTNHFYFLITTSLYQSKYRGYDKIERNTKFNGNYSVNVLGGYEWKLGKNILLSANTKISYMGGNRYIPVRVISNNFEAIVDYDYAQTYTKRFPDYFRLDLNVNMKTNFKRWAFEIFMEVNNITNHKNVWYQYYNVNKEEEVFIYQYGLMPMGGCRVYF